MLYRPPEGLSLQRLAPQAKGAAMRVLGRSESFVSPYKTRGSFDGQVYFIPKDHPSIVGRSGRIVLRLPKLREPNSRMENSLVMKLVMQEWNEGSAIVHLRYLRKELEEHINSPLTKRGREDLHQIRGELRLLELMGGHPNKHAIVAIQSYFSPKALDILSKEGYPVVPSLEIPLGRHARAVIQPDLSEGGEFEVHEVTGFDFDGRTENPDELKRELGDLLAAERLKRLERDLRPRRHISRSEIMRGESELAAALRKSFFVRVNKKNRIGELALGDEDNIELSWKYEK